MSKSFSELIKKSPKRFLLVDAMNLSFRWKHSGALKFAEDYRNTVLSLAKSYDCGTIYICADWGSSSYRKAIDPEYKGNRVALRKEQTEEEAEAFKLFFKEYENTLEYLNDSGLKVIRYSKVEADDIIAYICKIGKFEHAWIISSDKDLDQLISDKVSRFSYVTRKEVTLEEWPYEVPIEQYIDYKCLMGDAGDNVLGIQGIGPKRAAALIREYGSIFDIYDAAPLSGKAVYIQNLNSNIDRLLLNSQLMDLPTYCGDAIGGENCSNIKEILNG